MSDMSNDVIQKNKERLEKELHDRFSVREEKIICYRYGLDDGQVHTLEETIEKFSTTRERIRQIEAKAAHRCPHRRHKLYDFLD